MRRLATLILATSLGFGGCKRQGDGGGGAHKAPAAPEAAVVTVATVTNAAWDRTVSIVGTLYPKDEAEVAAQAEGMIEKTLVDFGDRVKAGQELALIDIATHEANLQAALGDTARAQAALTNATRSFERANQLVKAQVSSTAEFDEARAAYKQAAAELKAAQGKQAVAQLAVQHSRVVAPFDGGIANRIVGRGDFVKTGDSTKAKLRRRLSLSTHSAGISSGAAKLLEKKPAAKVRDASARIQTSRW